MHSVTFTNINKCERRDKWKQMFSCLAMSNRILYIQIQTIICKQNTRKPIIYSNREGLVFEDIAGKVFYKKELPLQ